MPAHIVSYTALIGMVICFILALKRILTRDNYINSLIISYLEKGELSQDELLDLMYQYGCEDFRLRRVLAKHQGSREDYRLIFDKLFYWANFKKKHRYIPISSFFFAGSLDYLLKHKDEDAKAITMKMMNYFHF